MQGKSGWGWGLLALSLCTQAAEVPLGMPLASEQVLVRANGQDPQQLDPNTVDADFATQAVLSDLFEGLVQEDDNGTIIPAQAERWEASADGKSITFWLRDAARWSDGQPVLAQDFVLGWQRAVNPKLRISNRNYLAEAGVANAELIGKGKLNPEKLGVSALEPKVLQVTFDKPMPFFMSMLSLPSFMPAPSHLVQQGIAYPAGPLVSNGAFMLEEWTVGKQLQLMKNAHYWDNAHTVLAKVVYLPQRFAQSDIPRIEQGNLHMTDNVPGSQYLRIQNSVPESLRAFNLLGLYQFSLNNRRPPLVDNNIRQALSMAVNRELITDTLSGQLVKPAYTVIPDNVPQYLPVTAEFASEPLRMRQDQARKLLEAAGFSAEKPLQIALSYRDDDEQERLANTVASMWKVIGVKVEMNRLTDPAFRASRYTNHYDVVGTYIYGDYNEPSALLNDFRCYNPSNLSGYCNKEFDLILDQAQSADADQRGVLYRRAEELLLKSTPLVPVFHDTKTRLVSATLQGLPQISPRGIVLSKNLYLTEG